MKSNKNEIAKALSMITQIGISVITPVLICVFGAKYLVEKFLPGHKYLIAIGALLGAASGIYTMIKLIRGITDSKKDE